MTPDQDRTAIGRTEEYRAFLAAKAQLAPVSGISIDPGRVHPVLKPHQRAAVLWAARGGRRALFEAFGLGKTLQQLEIERLILAEHGGGRGLIVCPLGVRQEFARDAALLGIETTFIRSHREAARNGVYLTNYESVRDGKLDPRDFDVICLDEAAVLRGFGGTKTFRELMRLYEGSAAFRFVATATPSPNEYIELLSYAAFLDILDVGQGKTRFFKRDSSHADRLTLHPHMEEHLNARGRLPSGFMLLQPPSWHDQVWTDVARMRTLNMMQERKGQQFHLCPLQFDIVERLIARYSNEGDTVLDPFGGLMTVPYCAVKMARRGIGIELSTRYFLDGRLPESRRGRGLGPRSIRPCQRPRRGLMRLAACPGHRSRSAVREEA
jgi:hypothetical protein